VHALNQLASSTVTYYVRGRLWLSTNLYVVIGGSVANEVAKLLPDFHSLLPKILQLLMQGLVLHDDTDHGCSRILSFMNASELPRSGYLTHQLLQPPITIYAVGL
jgi:hypothetical protein